MNCELTRYARQTMMEDFGEERQQKLMTSAVLIVGLGGLGAPVATYLTAAGVGRIALCDRDTVGLTNLQRQILYTEDDINEKKTDCACRRLSAMSPHTLFDIYDEGLTENNADEIISQYDVVVDCTDNFAARQLIDKVCSKQQKPWIHGSIDRMYGMLTVFNHHKGRRYADLYPEATDVEGRIIGTLGPVPGVVGSMQALETIKVLTGCGDCLDGRLLLMELDKMNFQIIEI